MAPHPPLQHHHHLHLLIVLLLCSAAVISSASLPPPATNATAISPTRSPSAPTPASSPAPRIPTPAPRTPIPAPTTPSPASRASTPVSGSSSFDPKQLRALQSLNVPTSKDPCSPSPQASIVSACDSGKPFRRLVSLTLSNCSDDVALSLTALKSLSTLNTLKFINCPVSLIRFPPELTSNLRSFTCINSLRKLTGVWLSRLQNLTDLTVSRATITASGPAIILNNMKFVHSVTLSRTNLSGSLPRHWHPNLTYIDLSGNNLKGRIPLSLIHLENLAHLNLSSNSLNGTIPPTFGDLNSLQNLSLASNSFSGSIPESLAAVPGLVHLDLGSNQLNGTIPKFIQDMKKLTYLNLEKNNFRGVLPFNATFIKRLEVFKVGDNSNLCYNQSTLGSKVKLGIARCDKHGLPMSPPPSKESSDDSSDSSDDEDYSSGEEKHRSNGPNKVVLGVAIGLSSIVFLIIFLVLLSKCCK